ncbi:hypothetical protein GIB67_028799 [Kingdonia uniflora]|uniref:Uncharacterized protein n=1 Tax=Kingdonia uniflora TaxID=39325 RepID=A0A7J7LB81_9MAGN|nr:hypothetical protein GIB67_028799 [Kingdonia uniflora]
MVAESESECGLGMRKLGLIVWGLRMVITVPTHLMMRIMFLLLKNMKEVMILKVLMWNWMISIVKRRMAE